MIVFRMKTLRLFALFTILASLLLATLSAPAYAAVANEGPVSVDPVLFRMRAQGSAKYVHDFEFVLLYRRTEASLMKWERSSIGGNSSAYRVRNVGSGLCLQAFATTGMTTLRPATCDWNDSDQFFYFKKNSNGSVSLRGFFSATTQRIEYRTKFMIEKY